ncbi:MAG TPA: DUF58 domain-containing protein [Thermomicrobiales bacterium]|nr:DUF58 domain-containing protein [Thermomicrobiales bacterium]
MLRPGRRPAAPPDEPLFDEAYRRRLERLALRTRQTLAWRTAGEHRSPRRAPAREFADFRPYSQGEDLRYLDWNTYARLGELVTRLGEVSTDLTAHVVLDTSASMNWGDPNKLRYAKRLAAALGYITLWHFDRLVVAPFAGAPGEPFGPRRGRAAIVPLLTYLDRLPASGPTDLARALGGYLRRAYPKPGLGERRPGILLLISDLLTTAGEDGVPALLPFVERGWDVVVFHVLDAEEVEPSYAGDLRLEDVEGAGALRVVPDDETVRRYRAACDAWLRGVEEYCRGHRIGYLRLLTAWPFETLVLRYLQGAGALGHPSDRRAGGAG